MQPRLPSEVVRAMIAAKGNPLPEGRDPARPGAAVPPGVFVEELRPGTQGDFRTAPRESEVVTIVVLWKSQPWRWWVVAGWAAFVLVIFAWMVATVYGSGPAFSARQAIPLGGLALFIALAIGFVGYEHLGRLLNKTRLRLDAHVLQVRHSPLPWAGNKSIARERIRKLFCVDDRGVIRVFAELDVGETWILRSTSTIGLTWEQAQYVVERLGPLVL